MLPNIDYRELPRALQHLLARGQTDNQDAAAPQLPEAGRRRRSGARRLSSFGDGSGRGPSGQRAQADRTAVGLRADRRQWRSHGDDQPAGVRTGRADRIADDPGGRTRRRLEPGAQPAWLERRCLHRPAVRHSPHRRFQFDQEQLYAVSRARRAGAGHVARCRSSALEGGRGHPAHAGRHGAGPGWPQAGLRRTGRGRDGAAGTREGHAEGSEGFPHHRPPDFASRRTRQEQRATGFWYRRSPARSADGRGRSPAGVRRAPCLGGRQRGARRQRREGRAARAAGRWRRRRGRRGRWILAGHAGPRRPEAAMGHFCRGEGR